MRRVLTPWLALMGCTPALRDQTPADAPAVVDARELIVLTAEAREDLVAAAETPGCAVRAIHPPPDLGDTLVSFEIPEGATIPEAIAEIETAAPGITAGADHVYQAPVAMAGGGRDHSGAMIGWPAQGCRAQVRVGMIDAGVATEHPGLADGRILKRAFTEGAAPESDHGALVAELLVGPDRLRVAALLSALIVDPALGGGDAAGVTPILRAADRLAAEGVQVVNVSLAGPYDKLMDRALGRAAADGMTFVAAAGILGPDEPPQYPAAVSFTLAVTAVDREGAVHRNASRGPHIDIAAPGVYILAAPRGRLRVSSGTSLAALTDQVGKRPGADIEAYRSEGPLPELSRPSPVCIECLQSPAQPTRQPVGANGRSPRIVSSGARRVAATGTTRTALATGRRRRLQPFAATRHRGHRPERPLPVPAGRGAPGSLR